MNPIFISLIALVVSLAGFSLSLFQFSHRQKINKAAKINETITRVYDLKRTSAELNYLLIRTDDIDLHEEIFKRVYLFTESAASILNSPEVKNIEVYHIEQALIKNRLEFDLFAMQIDEQIRFNSECHEYERGKSGV